MSQYLIEFIPLEPYFFGNEKSANFDQNQNKTQKSGSYFTRSEKWPSQSALFGVLRLIGLKHFNEDFRYDKIQRQENANAVGAKSFDLALEEAQDFGMIKNLSPVLLAETTAAETRYLIRMPLNHRVNDEEKEKEKIIEKNKQYKPFKISESLVQEWKLPENYNAKVGLSSDYLAFKLSEEEPEILENEAIFKTVVKTGIKTGADEDSFFKKEYILLNQNYRFVCFAELEKEPVQSERIVTMGQGKSGFLVLVSKDDNGTKEKIDKRIKKILEAGNSISGSDEVVPFYYAASDCRVSAKVLKECFFAVIKTREYRSFVTKYEADENSVIPYYNRFERGENLFNLIEAGSVFYPKASSADFKKYFEHQNLNQVGFNHLILSGGEK